MFFAVIACLAFAFSARAMYRFTNVIRNHATAIHVTAHPILWCALFGYKSGVFASYMMLVKSPRPLTARNATCVGSVKRERAMLRTTAVYFNQYKV